MMKKILLFFVISLQIMLYANKTNRADYYFDVELDDKNRIIRGYADIVYKNFTQDTLKDIVFHLYANLFRKDGDFLKRKIKSSWEGYTRIDSILEENERNDSFRVDKTLGYLKLKNYILPYDSLKLRIYFENKVPYPFLREGYSKGEYNISQWYPKVAVYKDGKWAQFQASRESEFFNEYGDYYLKIRLPKKYFLFGTGDAIYPDEDKKFLDSLLYDEKLKYKMNTNDSLKIVELHALNVNDMAFILVNDFSYLKKEKNGITVEIACRKRNFKYYKELIEKVHGILDFYSNLYFPYPYSKITIVDGLLRAGGGMEYPQFIVMGPILSIDRKFRNIVRYEYLEDVISHEIAHQWFYLMIGSNEAMEPFLDEGFATYSQITYMENRYGEKNQLTLFNRKVYDLFTTHYLNFLNLQKNKKGVPINYSSFDTKKDNYTIFYSKGYLIIKKIEDIVLKDSFKIYIKDFFKEYKFTHPSIDEFFKFINERSGGKYQHSLKSLLYENIYTDYCFEKISQGKEKNKYVLKNLYPIDLPVDVKFIMKDGESFVKRVDVQKDTIMFEKKSMSNITIDPEKSSLDINYFNNSIKPQFKIHTFFEIFEIDKNNLYFYPFFDYTILDKFTPGVKTKIFDLLKISSPYFNLIGDYSIDIFTGYNIKNESFYLKFDLNTFQENRVGNGIYLKYSKEFVNFTPKFFYFLNEKDFGQNILISYNFRKSLSPSDYYIYLFPQGKIGSMDLNYNFYKNLSQGKIRGEISLNFYDKIIYSDFNSVDLKTGLNYDFNLSRFNIDLGYDFEFLKGENNSLTSINLYSRRWSFFDRYTLNFSNYPITLNDIAGGYGYLTDTTQTFKYLNRFRVKINFIYQDLIIAGKDKPEIFYQTGLIFNFFDLMTLQIPLYNKDKGFIVKDRLDMLFDFKFIKNF